MPSFVVRMLIWLIGFWSKNSVTNSCNGRVRVEPRSLTEGAERPYLGIIEGELETGRSEVSIGHGEREVDDQEKMSDDAALYRCRVAEHSVPANHQL